MALGIKHSLGWAAVCGRLALISPGEGSLDEDPKRSTRDERIARLLDAGDATAR
jgi:hypothetical protein